jgi:phage baseplate assembly protein V
MHDAAELFRLLSNLIRTGTVFDVDLSATPPAVRVRDGAWESGWLQWTERRAGTTKTWSPPTVGEQVLAFCLGGDTAAGYVITGLNSAGNPPPSTSADEDVKLYPDGARIIYNHAAGALTATGIKTARLQAADLTEVDCPQTIFTGAVTVQGLFTYQAGMSGKNGKGNNTSIQGDLTHTSGNLSSNGVVVHTHTHAGVQRGGSSTDGPN